MYLKLTMKKPGTYTIDEMYRICEMCKTKGSAGLAEIEYPMKVEKSSPRKSLGLNSIDAQFLADLDDILAEEPDTTQNSLESNALYDFLTKETDEPPYASTSYKLNSLEPAGDENCATRKAIPNRANHNTSIEGTKFSKAQNFSSFHSKSHLSDGGKDFAFKQASDVCVYVRKNSLEASDFNVNMLNKFL